MKSNPKITVIVPIYKVPIDKLKNCINSIIKQTYKNIEIILVDDGSHDECSTICDSYAEKDNRIIVIHQNNKGLSGARNTGVKHCSCDYYTFVDGDDYLKLDGLTLIAEEIEDSVDIICTKTIAPSKSENINNYPYDNKIYSTDEELYYLRCMLLNFYGNNNSSCGKLYSKKFTDKYNLFHDEFLKQGAEDLEFNFRVFKLAHKIKIIDKTFYQCVYNSKSITRSFNEENEYLKIECLKKIKSNIDKNDKELLNWFYNRSLYMIVNSAISGFFSPINKYNFSKQCYTFEKYLNEDILKETLMYDNELSLDKTRRLIIFLINHKLFLIIKCIAIIRYYQKKYSK